MLFILYYTINLAMLLIMYYTYMLRCSDKSIYTGMTNDINKRIEMHKIGKGAKYTKSYTKLKKIHFYNIVKSKGNSYQIQYLMQMHWRSC